MTFEPGEDRPVPNPQLPPAAEVPQPQAEAQPVWVQPAPPVQWKQSEPLEYHQLYRGAARYRWWKPLLTLLLGAIYYITFSVVFSVPVLLLYGFSLGGDMLFADISPLLLPDTQNPWSIVLTLGSIALMIPAVWLAMLSTGLTPAGRGWSVALRIRWRWIWGTVLPAVVALLVMNVLGITLEIAFVGGPGELAETPMPEIDVRLALISLLLVLLLVPLQATAEELVYRGLFMQTLGAWLGGVRGGGGFASFLRGPWLPILIPALLFGFSHIYDIWGFLGVSAMAIAAGWLAWRTGGLEAAITLHVINNIVAFGFMSMGAGGETAQTESGGGLGSLLGQLAGFVLYCWWVDRSFSKRDGRRTRIDWVQVKPGSGAANV